MGWIEDLKGSVGFRQVAESIGMTNRTGKRWYPCPACNEDHTKHDKRPCVTVGADGGWKCWACSAKGDALTLLCYKVAGAESPSADGWEAVRQVAVKNGWIKDGGGHAGTRVRSFRSPKEQPKRSSAPTSPVETPEEKEVNTKGLFRWSDELPARCAQAMPDPDRFASDPYAAHYAKAVVEYLTVYRKISWDVLLEAKIGIYVDEHFKPVLNEMGRPFLTIPLNDKAGRTVNIHFRSVPIGGTCAACDAMGPWKECESCRKGKRYRVCPGRPMPLYGADRLTPSKGAEVKVFEGELDVLACRTYGFKDNVISGSTGASAFADGWLDELEQFDSISLCYDDDDVGKKGAIDLAGKVGNYRCSRVTFPKKDIGDCLISGVPKEAIQRAFKVAESFLEVKLRTVDEFRERAKDRLRNVEERHGISTTVEVLDTAIGGLTKGLYVVTGETGQGKSTYTTWQLWALAKSGQAVAYTSFENSPDDTVMQLLHMELGGMPDDFKEPDWDRALDRLAELPIYIVDHYGHLPYVKLEEAIKYAVRRCGVKFILLDHLGFLVDPEADDERRAIESVVRSLVLIRKDMDVTIFLIVHPRNDPDASKKWGRVMMQHIKGASAIRQDADMVIIVAAEPPNTERGKLLPKDKRRPWPQTRLYIDKKRGRYGTIRGSGEVVLAFDPKALVFGNTWADTPMGRAGLLVDGPDPESMEGPEGSGSSRKAKGGAKGGSRGRKKLDQESSEPTF